MFVACFALKFWFYSLKERCNAEGKSTGSLITTRRGRSPSNPRTKVSKA